MSSSGGGHFGRDSPSTIAPPSRPRFLRLVVRECSANSTSSPSSGPPLHHELLRLIPGGPSLVRLVRDALHEEMVSDLGSDLRGAWVRPSSGRGRRGAHAGWMRVRDIFVDGGTGGQTAAEFANMILPTDDSLLDLELEVEIGGDSEQGDRIHRGGTAKGKERVLHKCEKSAATDKHVVEGSSRKRGGAAAGNDSRTSRIKEDGYGRRETGPAARACGRSTGQGAVSYRDNDLDGTRKLADQAVARKGPRSYRGHFELSTSKEGGGVSGPNTMGHKYVKEGKFLKERSWTKEASPSLTSSDRTGGSSIDGGTRATPPQRKRLKKMRMEEKEAKTGGSKNRKKAMAAEGEEMGGAGSRRRVGATMRNDADMESCYLGPPTDRIAESKGCVSRDASRPLADQTVAWEEMGIDKERVELFKLTEGGSTYKARVLDHSHVGGGKFLVEWSRKAVTLSPEEPLAKDGILCRGWIRLDELIVPSAAIDYLNSKMDLTKNMDPHDDRKAELCRAVEELRIRLARDNAIGLDDGEQDFLAEIDFCCYLCRCDNKKRELTAVSRCGIVSKFHRDCCHGLTNARRKEKFCSSLGQLQKKILDRFVKSDNESSDDCAEGAKQTAATTTNQPDRNLKQKLLESRIDSAQRNVSRTEGDYHARPAQETVRQTDPVAVRIGKDFLRICQNRRGNERRAVVLDVFSGIGCGVIALKKLGIDIRCVISVDHDRVAQHVYRWNHDHTYGGDATDDGIDHVVGLYETYEELEENVEDLVREHGPVDIVIGGPPCQEYTGINAWRKGAEEQTSGRYMKDFAGLISRIRVFNEKYFDGFNELFFLVENVPGAEKATDDYCVSEFRCDAASFGPCNRDRVFYFNWQPNAMPEDNSAVGATTCLVDGWMMPSYFKYGIDTKAFTLLASKSRVRDVTLLKWKIKPGMEGSIEPGQDRPSSHSEEPRLFDTNDRERLMGMPVDYVRKPTEALFTGLRQAFMAGVDNRQWRDAVSPVPNWNFLYLGPGGYTFSIDDEFGFGDPNMFRLSIKEINQKSKVCMDSECYSWHLIGNGFSIPQIMYLLKPLSQLFRRRDYPGYSDSKFAWEEAFNANDRAQAKVPPVKEEQGKKVATAFKEDEGKLDASTEFEDSSKDDLSVDEVNI